MTCLSMRAPDHYTQLVDGAEGVRIVRRAAPAEIVHAFCARRRDVAPMIERALASVKPGGMIWMSWPKKSSALFKDLTEQDLRDHILPLG